MRIPTSPEEIYQSDVALTWHAGFRFCEITDQPMQERIAAIVHGIAKSGVIVGGQLGGQFLVRATSRLTDQELGLVFERTGDSWLIITVLKWEHAVANMEMRQQSRSTPKNRRHRRRK